MRPGRPHALAMARAPLLILSGPRCEPLPSAPRSGETGAMTEHDDPRPDAPPPAQALPPLDGDAPLHELGRDELSAFLYESLVGEELVAVMRQLGVSIPGFRHEALHDAQKADAIADTVRAQPPTREAVIAQLRATYEFPSLESVVLPPPVADELGLLAVESDAPVRMLWRLLADPSPAVRASGRRALKELAQALYGPTPPGTDEAASAQAPAGTEGAGTGADREALKAAQKEARQARTQAERAQAKSESLKVQLKALRAELAEAQKEGATHRRTAEKLDAQLQRTQARLEEARAKPARAALETARREVEELTARATAFEERQQRTAAERDALEQQLETLRREREEERAHRPQPAASSPGDEEAATSEAADHATWALPRFSREFYDSLAGWDARIQRAAFKQALLLAENHRHPSLRALPLEGLPGYFRVRIATDVRLIYRRGERDRDVELLSLIDREDLDRYVRQAKTR